MKNTKKEQVAKRNKRTVHAFQHRNGRVPSVRRWDRDKHFGYNHFAGREKIKRQQ